MDDYALLADEERRQRENSRTATPDDIYAGMAADEAVRRDDALNATLRQAVPVKPDAAAQTQALSKTTGIAPDVIERNKEQVTTQARVQELQRLMVDSPILARQMADPSFAQLAHDDAENLSLFERTMKTYLGASVKSGLESLVGASAKLVDAFNPFTLSEQDAAVLFKDKPAELAEFQRTHPSMALARFTRAMQQASENTMGSISPEAKQDYGDLKYFTLDPKKAAYLSPIKVAGDAIQSLPTTLALAATVYITKGTAARVEAQALEAGMSPELARKAAIHAASETAARLGAATEGAAGYATQAMQTREQADKIPDEVLQGSPEYKRLITEGYTPEAARVLLSAAAAEQAGKAGGLADAIVNFVGGGILGKIIGEGGALLKRMGKGAATEAATEGVQSGLEQLGQNQAVQAFLNPHQELLDGVAESIAQGFVVGGVMGGAFSAAAGRKRSVEAAGNDAKALEALLKLANADKLRERSPEAFAQFVQAAADEQGTSAVFMDARTFAQAAQEAGLDIAKAMPETAKQMQEAIATQGDVRIPLGELTAAIPGTGLENVLLQNARTSLDAPTLAEISDKKFAEETQAEVAKIMAEQEFTAAHNESAAVVEKEILAQLSTANRFTKDVNDVKAKVASQIYKVLAARLGITPEQAYVLHPLRINAESVAGESSLDQKKRLPPKLRKWFGKSKVTDEDGNPLRVFHGTTADFDTFDQSRGNIESDWGAGFYFTNTPEDVAANYAGEGPDLTQKIELLAERIEQESDGEIDMAEARKRAREHFSQHGGATMPVYLSLQNPLIVGGDAETFLDYEHEYEPLESFQDDDIAELRERDYTDEEIRRELSDRNHYEPTEKGSLVDFIVALRNIASRFYDADVETLIDSIMQEAMDYGGIKASKLQEIIKADEKFGYSTDENGTLASHEIARQAFEAAGFDGIIDHTVDVKFGSQRRIGKPMQGMREETVHYIAFRPEQVKSAIGNSGAFNPNDPSILKQETIDNDTGAVDEQPPFFSMLSRQIETAKMNVAPAAQWKSFINGLASKGVKKEEILMSGIMDWLDTSSTPQYRLLNKDGSLIAISDKSKDHESALDPNNPYAIEGAKIERVEPAARITKEQVLNFLSENGVRVEEKILGEPPKPSTAVTTRRGEQVAALTARELPPDYSIEPVERNGQVDRYRVYDGDGNEIAVVASEESAVQRAIDHYENGDRYINRARQELEEERGNGRPRGWNRVEGGGERVPAVRHARNWQSQGGRDYRELILSVPNIEPYNASDSTHFQTDTGGRTIAWTRFKIHNDANGTPTLFVEEIQSQRAQAGREQGFKGEEQKGYFVYLSGRPLLDAFPTREAAQAYLDETYGDGRPPPANSEIRQETRTRSLGVPTAPFVHDTQAWTALVLKRLVRYAADKGITQIAWTPGEEQIVRYGNWLREQIDSIYWRKEADGIQIIARQHSDVKVDRKFDPNELRSAVGASIAEKIVNDPNQEGDIMGRDLTIDDLGMANFYGNENGMNPKGKPAIVPIVADKIAKSLGNKEGVKQLDIVVNEGGKTFTGAAGFEITPEMAAKAKGGLPLFQNERGLYNIDTKTITLLKNADLSTFFHELGHWYLELLTDIASQPNAPVEIQTDMNTLLKWFGVKDLETWSKMSLNQKRAHHEQFARGFESYLFEGKAPSVELNGVFARIRAWMINVYRQLTALNVELSDEVRQVFDRMLATNDEILQAEAARNYAPLFKSAEEMGATPEEWRAYQEQSQEATQAAVDQLQARSLRDMKWSVNARGRILKKLQKDAAKKRKAVESEVTAEVREQPVYAALRFLTHGELPEAKRSNRERKLLEAMAGMKAKLSIPALTEMYGDGPAAPWRYLNTGKFGTLAAEDGLHPDMVAELFGFTSGDELVRKILAAEPEATVIEGMTDQRMLERYGDLSSPEAMERAASEAIHNEVRAKFIATELRALAKATGERKILVKAAKDFAATIIARKKIREIRPAQYAAAEARAGRAAERAKSLVEKATEKRNQLVNHYATRAAHEAIEEIEKGVAYLRRVGESKTIDPDYRDQIVALLERFELRPITNREAVKRASLMQWVEEQRERGFEPVIDAELLNEAKRMPFREMPLEEFRGLVDAVKNIEHLGRLKHTLLKLADQREFAAVVEEAATAIEANAKKTIPTKLERNRWTDKMKDGVAQFFAMHRKFASMIREMDGFKDGGVLWKLFVRPMNDAANSEAIMREKATIELQKLLAPVLKQGKMKEKLYIKEINASLSREGRIMVALNTGNEGNLQRLMDGDGWTIHQVQAIIDTLTKPEMDFVQAVWDFIGSYRDAIGAQQRRLTGVAPEWVEPRPVQTVHGEYRGGYIPAKYDTTRSTRSLSDEAAAGIMDMWRAKRGAAKTRDSFTKERANKVVDRPLRKDFGVITQHITEVTHRLAWQEYLMDAQRLLRAKAVDNAIREHYGAEVFEAMRNTLEDIATGEVGAQNAFEQGVNYLRTGATIAGLGWRLTTSLLQPIGLTQSMVRIGPKYVARGMAEWLGNAAKMERTFKRIAEKSEFMRLRAKTMQREISEIRNVVSDRNSAIEASYFYLIQKMQLVADIPTWLGQYHKSVERGADEAQAIAEADQAVLDAQGGGQIKDLAAIQRGGPLLKLFTNFYSFFNTTYNLTTEAFGRVKKPMDVGFLAVDLLLLYSVPAAMGTLLKAALHSGDDGADDEKKLIRQLIADQLTYLFGTMVGLRETAGGIQTALGLPGDYSGPASVRLFAELAKLGKQAGQGEIDEALLKAAANTAGILFHLPSGQVSATLDGIVTMAEGKTSNPGALIVGSNKK